eukprot:113987_1
MSNVTTLKLLASIFRKILDNPQNDKYKHLNCKRIHKKFDNECMEWLYTAGFAKSHDNKQLILPKSNITNVRQVYDSLMLILENQPHYVLQKEMDSIILSHPTFESNHLLKPHVLNHSIPYHCQLDECLPLEIIGNVLKRYQLYIQSQGDLSGCTHTDIKRQIYNSIGNHYDDTELLNDYNHLLLHHASDFEHIYNILLAVVNACLPCSLKSCLLFIRNRRDRRQMPDDVMKELYFNEDDPCIITQQLIDRIHCYFFHSLDTGYKIGNDEAQHILHSDEPDQKVSDDTSYTQHDLIVARISDLILRKNKSLSRTLTVPTKFLSNINLINKYDFGANCRYYYWDYYKNASESMDPFASRRMECGIIADQLKNWYIHPKYNNFKHELLNNQISRISEHQWKQLTIKANIHLGNEMMRNIFCARGRTAIYYGMHHGQPMNPNHLISMMIYCNYDYVQYKFTETFRKLKSESDDQLKKRHSNFHFLGRFLREIVECFGMDAPSNVGCIQLYHGVNKHFTFDSLHAFIAGPFSTTTNYSVAVNFADNTGLVIELSAVIGEWRMGISEFEGGDAYNRMNCFDCRWISDFSNECEILSIGSLNKFYIENISNCTGMNYQIYIKAIHHMAQGLSIRGGPDMKLALGCNIIKTNNELKMMYLLLRHHVFVKIPNHPFARRFEACPEYVKTLLHHHCKCVTEITVQKLSEYHKSTYTPLRLKQHMMFKMILVDQMDWLDLNVIIRLFPHVTSISYAIHDDVLFLNAGPPVSVFQLLLDFIKEQTSSLRRITIQIGPNVRIPNDFCHNLKQYQQQFHAQSWTCFAQTDDQLSNVYNAVAKMCSNCGYTKEAIDQVAKQMNPTCILCFERNDSGMHVDSELLQQSISWFLNAECNVLNN